MRCVKCGSEENTIKCKHRGANEFYICMNCCMENQNWDLCNTTCERFQEEKMNYIQPQGIELTRVYDGKTTMFANDLFLPNIYSKFICEVKTLQINILNVNFIELIIEFKIESNAVTEEIYFKDKWKKNANGEIPLDNYPLLQIYTPEDAVMRVVPYSYSVDEYPYSQYSITSNQYFTWMPFATVKNDYINTKELPEFEGDSRIGKVISGQRFFGRNSTIWGDVKVNSTYKIAITIEYKKLKIERKQKKAITTFGIHFPYSFVNVHDYTIYNSDELCLSDDSCNRLLIPRDVVDERLFLTPIDGNQGVIETGGSIKHKLSDIEKTFHYDRHSIFYHILSIEINDGFDISLSQSSYPLLTGVYQSLNRLYNGKFAPVIINITNTDSRIRKISIVSKIKGLSGKFEKHYAIKPFDVIAIPVQPILNDSLLKNFNEIKEMSIEVDIYEKGKRIFSETKEIEVHPIESFIFNINIDSEDSKVYFYQLLACYCTPHQKGIEVIITKASKKTGSIKGALCNNYDQIMKELEAIYTVISEDIRYVTRSFNFKLDKMVKTQRINLPSTTLSLKSGNCIDLSLLLASAFEACKLEVDIVVLPGHAMVAVKVTEIWIYIEATMLGYREFADAVQQGDKIFNDNFISHNNAKNNDSRMVSISLARKHGILPFE